MARLPSHEDILAQARPHRSKWGPPPPGLTLESPGPGQESVWDFPRPPRVRPAPALARVEWAGREVARSDRALEIVETAGAPVIYFPPEDVDQTLLRETDLVTLCEWKGAAVHYDLIAADGARSPEAAFAYPDPLTDLPEGYERVAGWLSFYPARVDACWLGEEQAQPQPGGLYAGWVTSRLAGPIKGAPGTGGW